MKTLILKILVNLASRNIIKISDEQYIKLAYKKRINKKINLRNPMTYNEKLQWLKLYDRNPEYTKMVDKYEVKKYVSDRIGEEYIIPSLGIYDKFDDIVFDKLPKQFVIKCTHDSGGLVICKDKSKLDMKSARKKINKSLKRNYYYSGREWPYKNVKPRLIIEEYIEDKKCDDIKDYKFFCFNGEPKIMYISEGMTNHDTAKMCFLDMNYNVTEIQRNDYKNFEVIPQKPTNFEKMKELSKILSQGIPHVRVDWYDVNGKIYFGEMTFYTCSGFIPFKKEEHDKMLGDMLELPKEKRIEK